MKLRNIERTIDSNTFQPMIKFSGEIGIELMQAQLELSESEYYYLIGKKFIEQIKEGLEPNF